MALRQQDEDTVSSDNDPILNWTGPHTITIPRTNQGFGFTLRHFIVYPPESPLDQPYQYFEDEDSDYGERRDRNSKCGLEPMDTIFVKHIRDDSPADISGLNTGDRIISVNGESVNGKTYSQVISLIQSSDKLLRLLVLPRDDDILQMAYPGSQGINTNTSLDTATPKKTPYKSTTVDENSAPSELSKQQRKDTPYKFESTYDYNPQSRQNWKNFYGSDSRVYRQPLRNDDSENKGISFRDRKIDRPVSEDTGGKMASISIPSKNTYSYGLIIPPKEETKASSVDNLNRNVSGIQYSRENSGNPSDNAMRHRRLTYDNRQSSTDSDSTMPEKKTSIRVSQSGRHSYTEPTTSFIISRSKTTSALANPSNRSSGSVQWNSSRRGSDNVTESTGTRHIVPVVSESSLEQANQFSTSVDSIDLRTGRYKQERVWQPSKPNVYDNSGRTFVVRIPVSSESQQRSGTTFALTRSPVTQIEIHKTPRPTVVHRKQQFEEGKNENITPRNGNFNRYKTEIEKLSSLKKFSSVANRTAQFESKSDASGTTSSDENGSPPLGTRGRKLSDQFRPADLQPYKPDRPTTLTSYSESAPIRIYVSPGSSSAPSSPIVEIVPLFPDQNSPRETNQRPTSYPQNASEDSYDGGYHARIVHENVQNNRPVRKTSYLSAVNAPRPRYSDDNTSPIPESPGINSVLSSSDGSVVISRVDTIPHHSFPSSTSESALTSDPVKYRKKTAGSLEEETLKLHRRTSYLMATAKDRSNLNQPIEQSFSPVSQPIHEEQQTPPNRNISLNKLKNFFGEKEKQETPSILEATEPHEPDSPLSHITKEGLLLCKTAVIDGKKSTDRSWRPLWVVLRGHALYLCKDKKEGTHMPSFEDQPISIKSCLIDIAHDYAKKKRNVFRLSTFNGSEYLFQTEDRGTMMSWIQAIKTNNDPDCDELSLASSDLISRKINSHELSQQVSKSSPQVPPKGKKLSGLKKLTGSPSLRRKKTGEKEEGKTKAWKKMMPKSFKKSSFDAGQQSTVVEVDDSNKTFGVYLKDCIPSPNNEFVPLIVELCARIVEARGLEVVGVYRVPGNSISVNAMQDDLNKGIENISIDNEKWLDVNVIASLLKAFFRKLPESLITDKYYDSFIASNRIENPEKRMLRIKRFIHTLPEHHFETFKYMAEHLNRVASFGHVNKMDAKNLAIMFGPTLIRKANDDTLSMVTDMSDQCRIVESIILHFDWFFSSWDQDDHVPLEETLETSPPTSSADTSRVLKDDDEELDSQIYAREIVSSIITAANRKLKCKETSKSCDELDCSPPAYSDLDLRRQGPPPPYSHSQSKITTSVSEEYLDRKPPRPVPVYDRKPPPPPPPYEQEWQMIFQKVDPNSRGAFTRHYSEDSLMDRNDELEISHSLDGSWNLSRDTLDRLRKIKKDTSLIIEREEQRRKDMEKRRVEQQRYEQEYQRTKEEIEREEGHSVDDLLRFSDFTSKINSMTNRQATPPKYSSNQNQGYLLARAHPVICGTKSDKDIKPGSSSSAEKSSKRKSQDSGKYFISIGNNRSRVRDKTNKNGMLGSLDSLAPCVPRAGSLENMLDHYNPNHVHGRISDYSNSSSSRRSRDIDTDSHQDNSRQPTHHKQNNRSLINRNSAMFRHGSLDSLIDLIDRQDNRNSWASTDSEDGLDLLTDLTTTFDQKLQILSNPKYRLNGSSRKSRTDSSSASTVSDILDEKDFETLNSPELPPCFSEQSKPQPVILPRYPQSLVMSASNLQDKKFQDPSLHRSLKSETKIGIASRFERNPHIQISGHVTDSTPSGPISLVQWTCSNPSENRVPIIKTPLKLTSPTALPNPNKMLEAKNLPKTPKSFKSEHSQKREEKSVTFSPKIEPSKRNSESPPSNKKPKRGKRRHTVGGVDDWENMKAIMTAAASCKEEPKSTAWEQLRPKENIPPQNRNLSLWIQQERLRGSTPDLSSLHLMESHDKSYYL